MSADNGRGRLGGSGLETPAKKSEAQSTEHAADWQPIAAQLRTEMGWSNCPPAVPCPWCGADPGVACRAIMPMRMRRDCYRLRLTPGGCHASRVEAVAA